MWDMPSFREEDGTVLIWDSSSKSYVRAPGGDINEKVDRGHASGGDNNLFDPISDDGHMFQPGNPDNNGWLDGKTSGNDPFNQWNEESLSEFSQRPWGFSRDDRVKSIHTEELGTVTEVGLDGMSITWDDGTTDFIDEDPEGYGIIAAEPTTFPEDWGKSASLEPYRDSDEFFGVEPPEPYMELGGQVAWDYAKQHWPDLEWFECPQCGAADSVSETNHGPHCWNPDCGWWGNKKQATLEPQARSYAYQAAEEILANRKAQIEGWGDIATAEKVLEHFAYLAGIPNDEEWATAVHAVMDQTGEWREGRRQSTNQVQVKCPNCGELSQMEVCPHCGKGLEPEWQKLEGGQDVPWESLPQQGTPQNEFLSDPTDRVPKVNWGQQSSDYGTMISRVEVDASEFI